MKRAAVCISHPRMLGGGSEITALWLLESVERDCDVTLLTAGTVAWEQLNQFAGTALDPDRITVRIAPMPQAVRDAMAGDAVRGAFFARFVRSLGRRFDVCISSYNFVQFGRPAIQFIADFSWDDEIRRAYDPVSPGLRGVMQRSTPLRWAYRGATDLIAGGRFDMRTHRGDVIVANSRWTADILKQRYDLAPRVIYPPVHTPAADKERPRSGDFVLLGRISPEKKVVEAIDLIARVRQRGHEVNLHIIGPLDGSAYSTLVIRRAHEAGAWVKLRGALYGDEKFVELGRHSFGLHMRQREAFGIVIVEMIKTGVIPFVPAHSAPAEIVEDERLCFDNEDHAVEIIDRLLRAPRQLDDIRQGLAARSEFFGTRRFATEVSALVEEQLAERATA